ncbi:MAG: M67 family metallopeptidase [Acidimicrobiia bacterium]
MIEIPDQISEAIAAHASFCYPEEACGLLAADQAGRLRMAYCLTNTDRSATAYTVEPSEHFHALRHAERLGWHLAGVFHSHTHTDAYPSPTDVARALEPDWLYLIVGPVDRGAPTLRGYWIRNGEVQEQPLSFE